MPDLLPDGQPLLIAAPASWRAACFSLPASRALAAAGHPVTILCSERQVPLWKRAGLGDVLGYPEKAKPRQIAGLLSSRTSVLLWEPGPASDACARAKLEKRLGPPARGLAGQLTEPIERRVNPGPPEHQVRFYLDLAAGLGADPLQPEHFRPLETSGDKTKGSILLVPDSDLGATYEWPVERWIELADKLREQGHSLSIGHLKGAKRALARSLGDAIRIPAESLELPAIDRLAGFETCLSAENSAVHLAAASGTRCAVLFGPGDPDRMRPLGTQHLLIRHKVECSPCLLESCPLDLRCQNELKADTVLAKLDRWLNPPA